MIHRPQPVGDAAKRSRVASMNKKMVDSFFQTLFLNSVNGGGILPIKIKKPVICSYEYN